jgi:hypothetical protein
VPIKDTVDPHDGPRRVGGSAGRDHPAIAGSTLSTNRFVTNPEGQVLHERDERTLVVECAEADAIEGDPPISVGRAIDRVDNNQDLRTPTFSGFLREHSETGAQQDRARCVVGHHIKVILAHPLPREPLAIKTVERLADR